MHRILLLWNTVRFLRPVQVWGRLWFRLFQPKPDLRAAPPTRPCSSKWRRCARGQSMTGPSRFRFHNVERDLREARDWNHSGWSRLWLYNLHYFDDLVAEYAPARVEWHAALIQRWLAENPPGLGTGWEPYPTSMRIVNLVKWALGGNALPAKALHSLAVQARWLSRRLEVHLLGNHLWSNAKALLFAGAYFQGAEAERWRDKGLSLLRRELAEQILPDGGHFERSPMYHAIVLEDVLDLVQLSQRLPGTIAASDVVTWRSQAVRMLRWLGVMSHPDGSIALFNDAALDIAADHAALRNYAEALGVAISATPASSLEALPDSGYVRMEAGKAVLIADVGEIGPDYLPGHAHADTLSFELSINGGRVLANGGTSTYEAGSERVRQRGTAAHNTVVVDSADSSEVWNSFRVARRARPHAVRWGHGEDGAPWLEAMHDGYRRLAGRVLHRRRWTLKPYGLVIEDHLDGTWETAAAHFHFVPGWTLEPTTGVARHSSRDGLRLNWKATGAGPARVQSTTWHPRFGVSLDCQRLQLPFNHKTVTAAFSWG